MRLTNYQRCMLLWALQQAETADPDAVDVLIERLSADRPWAPWPSLAAWQDHQLSSL